MANSHVQGLSLRTQVHVMTLGRTWNGINNTPTTYFRGFLVTHGEPRYEPLFVLQGESNQGT